MLIHRPQHIRMCIIIFVIAILTRLCTINTAPKAPLVITIHGAIHTIESDAGCNKSLWGNNIENACECCLLQKHAVNPTKTADKIVQSCIKDVKLCTEQSITKLKSAKKVPNDSSDTLLAVLYDDVIIRPMVFDTSLLTSNGQFTQTSLPQFLAQAYREKKLTDPTFSNAECLKVKNIATQGGYNTLQL